MLKRKTGFLAASAVLLLALGFLLINSKQSIPLSGNEDSARIMRVHDGDTVHVRFSDGRERKVRLLGIDAPEMGDSRETVRIQANLAKRFAFHHLYRKDVRLAYDWDREDDYGRLLAYIWVGGELFNAKMITAGFAFAYRRFPYGRQKEFIRLEEEARRGHKGLWGEEYVLVEAADAGAHLGRLAAVRFLCDALRSRRGFTFLETKDRGFALLIPDSEKERFGGMDLPSMAGRELIGEGFLEEFGGQLQIVVVSPDQIVFESPD
jgi:micrococcal nuclease